MSPMASESGTPSIDDPRTSRARYQLTASSVELAPGRLLAFPDPARGDVRAEVVFALDRRPGEAPQHRDLPDVRERIGNRTLKDFRGRKSERRVGREARVECLESREESRDVRFPGRRRRFLPLVLAAGERESPVEEIADVRENLTRSPRRRRGADVKLRKTVGCSARRLAAAVGQSRDRVPEKLPNRVRCRHASSAFFAYSSAPRKCRDT